MDSSENRPANPRYQSAEATLSKLIEKRYSRRGFLTGTTALGLGALTGCGNAEDSHSPSSVPVHVPASTSPSPASSFDFTEITRGMDETHHVADEFQMDVLLRWGDKLHEDSPEFDPLNQSETAQLQQFGDSCDFVGLSPLPTQDGEEARAILCVNHEFTRAPMMFPGIAEDFPNTMTKAHIDIEMAAHGGSLVEIFKKDGTWHVDKSSVRNRRITAHKTPMQISGPAAGSDRLKTTEDPDALTVSGTLNNCAGGMTPWGTYLMAEENFNGNFLGKIPDGHKEASNHQRYGVPGGWYVWGKFYDRYNVEKEPNEPNRFGWVVEVDPLEPDSMPKKRTALGRFKHEGAESIVSKSGQIVLYSGDDQRFEYVYKFVTKGVYNADDRQANANLLDEGTLYAARFEEDGGLIWLPLIFGEGPLTEENGFSSQADIVIETRRAADLLGATPMDRPEDIQPNPKTGKVYVMLTNNTRRKDTDTNAANPRGPNAFGHIVEISEENDDHTSLKGRWDMLIQCGDPDADEGARWNPATSQNGWFASPDNCEIDHEGRLWISTDGNDDTGAADGLWAIETEGDLRGTAKHFYRAPIGAEVCGPRFSDDGKTVFLAIQHPGWGRGATFENPSTRWPDFDAAMPPRSSIVAISRKDGEVI